MYSGHSAQQEDKGGPCIVLDAPFEEEIDRVGVDQRRETRALESHELTVSQCGAHVTPGGSGFRWSLCHENVMRMPSLFHSLLVFLIKTKKKYQPKLLCLSPFADVC
jgi:hypothetical protein